LHVFLMPQNTPSPVATAIFILFVWSLVRTIVILRERLVIDKAGFPGAWKQVFKTSSSPKLSMRIANLPNLTDQSLRLDGGMSIRGAKVGGVGTLLGAGAVGTAGAGQGSSAKSAAAIRSWPGGVFFTPKHGGCGYAGSTKQPDSQCRKWFVTEELDQDLQRRVMSLGKDWCCLLLGDPPNRLHLQDGRNKKFMIRTNAELFRDAEVRQIPHPQDWRTRRNLGYLYVIEMGAEEIIDVAATVDDAYSRGSPPAESRIQETLWDRESLWALVLPVDVSWNQGKQQKSQMPMGKRESHNWRELMARRLMRYVEGADRHVSKGNLSNEFVMGWKVVFEQFDGISSDVAGLLEELVIDFYQAHYFSLEGVQYVQQWLWAVLKAGYELPPVSRIADDVVSSSWVDKNCAAFQFFDVPVEPSTSCWSEEKVKSITVFAPGMGIHFQKRCIFYNPDPAATLEIFVYSTGALTQAAKHVNTNRSKSCTVGFHSEPPSVHPQSYKAMHNDLLSRMYDMFFTFSEKLINKHPNKFKRFASADCWACTSMKKKADPHHVLFNTLQAKKRFHHDIAISHIFGTKSHLLGRKMRHTVFATFKDRGLLEFCGSGANRTVILKQDCLYPFLFSVVIENDFDQGYYFSEKLVDAFANGVVPIYWGTGKYIQHWFNASGMIFWETTHDMAAILSRLDSMEKRRKEYFSRLEALKCNFRRAIQMTSSMGERLQSLLVGASGGANCNVCRMSGHS